VYKRQVKDERPFIVGLIFLHLISVISKNTINYTKRGEVMCKKSRVLIVGTLLILFQIIGCSSINKAKLSSDNPKKAIVEVTSIKDSLIKSQVDLLAHTQFKNGERDLEGAIQGLKQNDDKVAVLEKLAQSKAYFQEASRVAAGRQAVPERLLAARMATLENGVLNGHDLIERLEDIDESCRDSTNNFTKVLPVEELSQLENDYLKLEIYSVQNMKLMVYRDIVKNAEENNAIEIAPKTYRDALNSLKAAENMIQQSPRNQSNYRQSIVSADKSSKLLSDVMEKLSGVAHGASEDVALQMVYQERSLVTMSDRATNLQSSLTRSENNVGYIADELKNKTSEAQRSKNKVLRQEAMEVVQKGFSKNEADVYQQGDNLIIRLKKIDFSSGSSMIPGKSMSLLARVNAAIVKLDSPKVVVQGHTDSTGQKVNNKILSMKRSEAVANYFQSLDCPYTISSVGFGESAPIANNQTKIGRAMNRRVDIIVSTNAQL